MEKKTGNLAAAVLDYRWRLQNWDLGKSPFPHHARDAKKMVSSECGDNASDCLVELTSAALLEAARNRVDARMDVVAVNVLLSKIADLDNPPVVVSPEPVYSLLQKKKGAKHDE